MAKSIAFDLTLNVGDTEKKIQEFITSTDTAKTKLRELEKAAIEASIGGNKALADTFAKAAGQLKDQIGDTRQEINNFSSDTKKLDVAVGAVQGLVGGFTAVAGAVGLLSGENKDLQKTIAVVTSSLAVLNGVQQISITLNKSSATGAYLYAAANTALSFAIGKSTGALKLFRVALAATGVGAIAVAIGMLIANWDKLVEVISKAIPGLEKVSKFFTNIFNNITDFIGITSDATRAVDKLSDAFDKNSIAIGNQIKVLEAQGNKEKEIFNLKKKLINDELDLLRGREAAGEKLTAEELKRRDTLLTDLEVLQINYDNFIAAQVKKASDEAIEKKKKADEEEIKVRQATRDAQIRAIKNDNERELALFDEKSNRELMGVKKNGILYKALLEAQAIERAGIVKKQAEKTKADADAEKKELMDLEKKRLYDEISLIYARRIATAEANGDTKELTLEQAKVFDAQELALTEELYTKKLIGEEEYQIAKKGISDKYNLLKLEEAKKVAEKEKMINDLTIEGIQSTFSTLSDINNAQLNNIKAIRDKDLKDLDDNYTRKRAAAEGNAKLQAQLDKQYDVEKGKLMAKQEAAEKRAFENNKNLQIAEALIATYIGAQKAFASQIIIGDPTSIVRGYIAAGLATVAGLARVALIKSTKYSGGSVSAPSGGTGAADTGGGGTPNTSTGNPFSGERASSVINPEVRPRGEKDVRVYVLESDISTTQRRVSVIENNSNASF